MAKFPIRKGITVLGPDDPKKRRLGRIMYEPIGDMVRIFPKEDDHIESKEELELDPIKTRFEILDL